MLTEFESNRLQFTGLFDVYLDPIYRMAIFKLGEPVRAEEATSRIFERAWQDFERFKRTNGRPKVWIYRLGLDELNRGNGSSEWGTIPIDFDQFRDGTDEDTVLGRTLLALPSKAQDYLILHEIEKLSDEDISEIMGSSPEDTRQVVTLGKIRLLELLELPKPI